MHLFGGQFKLLTVIARAKRSSKYSTLSMVHRERCTSKVELSLTISMTVIARAKRSSKYSTLSMVHREEGIDHPLGLCTHASLTLHLIQKNALNKTADLG